MSAQSQDVLVYPQRPCTPLTTTFPHPRLLCQLRSLSHRQRMQVSERQSWLLDTSDAPILAACCDISSNLWSRRAALSSSILTDRNTQTLFPRLLL
jgi:hypothetical protein